MAVVFHLIFRFFFTCVPDKQILNQLKNMKEIFFRNFRENFYNPKKSRVGIDHNFFKRILEAVLKTNKIEMFSNICEKNKFANNFHLLPTLTSKKSDSCFKNHRQACLKPCESAEIKKQFGEHKVFRGTSRKAQKTRHELSDQSPHRVNLIRGEQIVLKSSQTRKN